MNDVTLAVEDKRDARQNKGLEGKYLTFLLNDEEYGIEVLKIREIIGYLPVTPVPQVPNYIKGVINLRGQVIPVVDLRTRLDMPYVEPNDETCIVVVETKTPAGKVVNTGLIVDKVREVLDISADQIDDSVNFGAGVDSEFILGIGKVGKSIKILLDIDKVLTSVDVKSVKDKGEEQVNVSSLENQTSSEGEVNQKEATE